LKFEKQTYNLEKKKMHSLKLENIPKIWKNMLGLFLNQTCFSIEQYGSNMVWTNVFQWNMVSKIKLEILKMDLQLGKSNLEHFKYI
jgi:hypothetical protein